MTYKLIQASAHDTGLPDKSVHMIATSPPYYGLRAYAGEQMIEWPTVRYSPMPGLPEITIQGCEPGCAHEWGEQLLQREQSGRSRLKWETGGQPAAKVPDGPVSQGAYCIYCGGWRGGLGNEPTPEAYIGHLILVKREMWRVLRDDGCAFINLGDSYNGSGKGRTADGTHQEGGKQGTNYGTIAGILHKTAVSGLKPKDLCMVPARFALAAQADGWYLRSDIIWHKPNPMPESVTDRPTKAHEFIYLLTKSEKYFYDADAVREITGNEMSLDEYRQKTAPGATWKSGGITRYAGANKKDGGQSHPNDRNRRSVWTVATAPYPGSHFATFPPALVEPMIKAGSSAYGVCPQCKAPWVRVVEKSGGTIGKGSWVNHANDDTQGLTRRTGSKADEDFSTYKVTTTGWQPTCNCGCADVEPATVLDPFSGSGTTGRVALQLGRSYIGIDVSKTYLEELAPDRLSNIQIELALA